MATEQVGTGGRVFRITRNYTNERILKNMQAYTDEYLKPLEERWQYNMRQAELNAAGRKDEYEAKMKLYQDALKQKSNRELARDKAVYAAKSKQADAQDKANIEATKQELKEREANEKLQEKRGEQVPVAQGGKSQSSSEHQSSGTTSSGLGGPVVTAAKQKAQAGIQAAKGQNDPLIDPVGLAKNVRTRTGVGNIAATDPDTADFTYHSTVEESISAKAGDLMRTGMPGDEARVRAESDVLGALEAGGAQDFAEGWKRESNKKAAASGVGGGTSQSSGSSQSSSVSYGSELQNKYKGLADVFPDLDPTEQNTILAEMTPTDRKNLIKDMEERKFGDVGPMPVYEPTDILTEARRLQGRYFGKTVESPVFEQRNRMDELLRMTPEQRAAELADFQASRPVAAPAPVPAGGVVRPPAAPAPAPAPAPSAPVSNQIPLTEEDMQGLSDNAPPLVIPQGSNQIPLTEADMQGLTDNAPPIRIPVDPRMVAARRTELEAVLGKRAQDKAAVDALLAKNFGELREPAFDPGAVYTSPSIAQRVAGPAFTPTAARAVAVPPVVRPVRPYAAPPSIGAKTVGALPEPVRAPMDMSEPFVPRPADISGAVLPAGPLAGQLPSTVKSGTDALIQKANEAAVKGKGALGETGAPEQESYYEGRINAAMKLKDQPEKLKRLASSGPGRVGLQLYTTNKAKGFPFPTTYTEIVHTFAGDKDAMMKAHDVALATAFAAHDSLNPKA